MMTTIFRLGVGVMVFGIFTTAAAEAIEIVSPRSGAHVRSGHLVTVRVAPSAGEILAEARMMTTATQADGMAVGDGSFEAQVRVPLSAVGPEFIIATVRLTDGTTVSAHVDIEADPGPLKRLAVLQPPALTSVGQIAQLEVSGVFEDGVIRDLTSKDTGTQYTSSNGAVLAVHDTGLVQARSHGNASVRVQSRGEVAVVTIPVDVPAIPVNQIPVADPGPDQTTAPLSVVTLSAEDSSDPDGDALSFRWDQISGPYVSLRSANSITASFLAPTTATGTVLEFALTVRDSRGASTLPERIRVTVTP